ncbi:MAG: nucleotidyltransferase domain-containing protein [Nitrospirae bacterium]|nr:nucleotidyltransferase domain-containing protein [Nitrospirota bacterium]
MSILTDEMLKEITREIVDAVNPVKVILFGSYATGNAGPNSDLDFLIVEELPFGPDRSRKEEMMMLWKLLGKFRIAKDILVYSTDEVNKWQTARNHIIHQALKKGRVLYERF